MAQQVEVLTAKPGGLSWFYMVDGGCPLTSTRVFPHRHRYTSARAHTLMRWITFRFIYVFSLFMFFVCYRYFVFVIKAVCFLPLGHL